LSHDFAVMPSRLLEELGVHDVQDVKFLGTVKSFDERKGAGEVECSETFQMWSDHVYAHKNILAACDAVVGDTIRFGIHVSSRGQPQASLPIYRVGEDGFPMDVRDGEVIINAEDLAAEDPDVLEHLRLDLIERSQRQNDRKRKIEEVGSRGGFRESVRMDSRPPKGGGKAVSRKAGPAPSGPPFASDRHLAGDRHMGAYNTRERERERAYEDRDRERIYESRSRDRDRGGAYDDRGKGARSGKGGKGPAPEDDGVILFIGGVPAGVEERELKHIFRQYAGFRSLRTAQKASQTLVFVTFATRAQAIFVVDALSGYVFDEDVPHYDRAVFTVEFAREKKLKAG